MTVKNKLIEKRIEKGYSQKEVAQKIGKEISGYNRRENGTVKISRNEWNKLAEVLECDFKDIYEPDDNVYVINGDYAQGNFGSNGTFNQAPEYLLELQQKYISKLEEENTSLKTEIKSLQEKIDLLVEETRKKSHTNPK